LNGDVLLTTRKLARMIKKVKIDSANLPDDTYDGPTAQYTGAANIFGVTVVSCMLHSVPGMQY
jgi:iron only hydrogenase large subunit-like protein